MVDVTAQKKASATTGSAQRTVAVTPSDTTVVNCRSVYVGTTGDLSIVDSGGGTPVVLKTVPVGILPVACQKIRATGTTATNLVALF